MNNSDDFLASSISHDHVKGSQLIYIGFGIGSISALICASIIAYSKYNKRLQNVNKCKTMYCEDDAVIQIL
jgi:CRISPR/Cas system CSM-associated protein Csm5 (group 7 of RAMP superfamily)